MPVSAALRFLWYINNQSCLEGNASPMMVQEANRKTENLKLGEIVFFQNPLDLKRGNISIVKTVTNIESGKGLLLLISPVPFL